MVKIRQNMPNNQERLPGASKKGWFGMTEFEKAVILELRGIKEAIVKSSTGAITPKMLATVKKIIAAQKANRDALAKGAKRRVQ